MHNRSHTLHPPGNAEPQLGTSLPIAEKPPAWRSRGYLPHFDTPGALQSITFRIADSLPRTKLAALEKELSTLPPEPASVARRKKIEEWHKNHFRAVLDYIQRNPVEAGLCKTAGEWPWSSAGLIMETDTIRKFK